MKKRHKIIFVFLVMFCFFINITHFAHAQIIAGQCIETGNCTLDDFIDVFDRFYSLILQWLSVTALLFFIIGGVMLMISAGNQEKIKRGRQILGSAFAGLVVILASYLIVQLLISTITGSKPPDLGGSCSGEADGKDCGDNQACLKGNCVTECYYEVMQQKLPAGADCRSLDACSKKIKSYNDCTEENDCWKGYCPIGIDYVCCL